jgi:hypothetical protein
MVEVGVAVGGQTLPPEFRVSAPTLMMLKSFALLSVSVPEGLRTAIFPKAMVPTLVLSLQLALLLIPTLSTIKLPFHTPIARGVAPKAARPV